MSPRRGVLVRVTLLATSLAGLLPAQVAPPRIDQGGIAGTLFLVGGGRMPPDVTARFVALAGGSAGRLVVIPTATARAETADPDASLQSWRAQGFANVVRLHTRDRAEADQESFVAPLREATAVWFSGGDQNRIAAAYLGTRVETELRALLARGGTIGGTSAGTAIQSRLMIGGGTEEARTAQGFDHLPGIVVDQHFAARSRQARLAGVLAANPGHVGLGVDESTALIAHGRRLEVVGSGAVHVLLAAGPERPASTQELKAGGVADLIALRRAAIDRTQPRFPPAEPTPPNVAAGALVIVGGGRVPAEVVARFLELAGGADAPIVVLPTAVPDPPADGRTSGESQMFARAGAKDVSVLWQRGAAVESEAFVAALRRARGVWFGGGRQWRFVDAYAGTIAVELFHDVLRRGGVIGGSSAGASIQAEYMVRGHPLGNETMMAEGYERGFGFLSGCAIDQHFTQRHRERDLASVIVRFPQLLGIGLDEGTAIVVQESVATVLGAHAAHFLDHGVAHGDASVPPTKVAAGARYDLAARKLLGK